MFGLVDFFVVLAALPTAEEWLSDYYCDKECQECTWREKEEGLSVTDLITDDIVSTHVHSSEQNLFWGGFF